MPSHTGRFHNFRNSSGQTIHPRVRISTGDGLSRVTRKAHIRRKIEFYRARDEYRAAIKESANARVKVFSEAAVACLALDEDSPL